LPIFLLGCTGKNNSAVVKSGPEVHFPPKSGWQSRLPEQLGMPKERLEKVVVYVLEHDSGVLLSPEEYVLEKSKDYPEKEFGCPNKNRDDVNGLIIRYGYIVAEWSDTRQFEMTFSATKSYVSMVAGLVWDRGLFTNLLDDLRELIRLVVEAVDDVDGEKAAAD